MSSTHTTFDRRKRPPTRLPLPVIPPDFDPVRDGNPPPPPVALSGGKEVSDEALGNAIVRLLTPAWREIAATAELSMQQGSRLLGWGCCHAQQRRIATSLRRAQERLGARMELLGCGDPAVKTQLAELQLRRCELELKGGSLRGLDAERGLLWQQLADGLEAQPVIPSELAPDREHLLALRNAQAALDSRLSQQRQNLFPQGRHDQLRLAATAGILCVLLLGGCGWMFSTPTKEQQQIVGGPGTLPPPVDPRKHDPGEAPKPSLPRDELKQTPEQPAEKVQKPELKPEPAPTPATTVRTGQQDFWVEASDYFPRRRFVGNYVSDRPHGDTKCLDANGRVICTEHYEHGVLHGKRTCFYPSGKKLCEMPFRNGVAHGTSTVWYESGVVAATTEIVDGQCTGEAITYFPNGKISVKVRNVDNVPHGEMLHFRPDGQCFAASDWDHGRQIGQDIQWDITQQDAAAIEARARFSGRPLDWWP